MRKKVYIPLATATEVHRRHLKDIAPPGLALAKNVLMASSDDAITVRPDFKRDATDIIAFSKDWDVDRIHQVDFVNAAIQARDSGDMVYFTKVCPAWGTGGGTGILSDTYTTGTVTVVAGESTATFSGTSLLQYVWPGCWFKINAGDELYQVHAISSDTALSVAGQFASDYTDAEYTIYRPHHQDRADWPMNIQNWGNEILYQAVIPKAPIDSSKFAGPFYSAINNATTSEVFSDITPNEMVVRQTKVIDGDPEVYAVESWITYIVNRITQNGGTPNTVTMVGTYIRYYQAWRHGEKYGDVTISEQSGWVATSSDATNTGSWTFSYPGKELRDVAWDSVESRFIIVGTKLSGAYTVPYIATLSGHTVTEITSGIDIGTLGATTQVYSYDGIAFDGTTYVMSYRPVGARPRGVYTCTAATLDSWTKQEITGNLTGESASITNGSVHYDSTTTKFYWSTYTRIYSCDAADVTTWTLELQTASGEFPWKFAGDGSGSIVCTGQRDGVSGTDGIMYYSDGAGTWSEEACDFDAGSYVRRGVTHDGTNFVTTNGPSRDDWFADYAVIGNKTPLIYYSADGQTWSSGAWTDARYGRDIMYGTDSNYYVGGSEVREGYASSTSESGPESKFVLLLSDSITATTSLDAFTPISDLYRSSSFTIIDGYVLMVGMLEFSGGVWNYYPRKARWTVPGTYANFTDFGSGAATYAGNGILLDVRTVNHRAVIFESNQISVLSPTGQLDLPFNYEVIADKLYTISNPVVVDNMVYFVGNNGLMYRCDGVQVSPLGNAFDLSKFDDFDESGPIWLDYSGSMKALMVYNKAQGPPYHMFMIALTTGSISRVELPVYAEDQTDSNDNELPNATPGGVFAVRGVTDSRVCVGYGITGADDDSVHMTYLNAGESSSGYDQINSVDGTKRWFCENNTGEFRVSSEFQRVHIHQVIVHSYCEAGSVNPDVAVMVRSPEDSEWRYPCQPTGTITVTDGGCTGSGTVWGDLDGQHGAKIADGDDVTVDFTAPLAASLCAWYIATYTYVWPDYVPTYTLQTAYTTSGNVVTFDTAPAADEDVYAFWTNEPGVHYAVGDYVYTVTGGYHRIDTVNNTTSVALDHYLATGSTDDTGYHLIAKQLPDGTGETVMAVDELVSGLQIRVLVFPRLGGTAAPRITGISIVYSPAGPEMRGD